jgi:hypothetical protein
MGGLVCQAVGLYIGNTQMATNSDHALHESECTIGEHRQKIHQATRGIIFLGTPHTGAALADCVVRIAQSLKLIGANDKNIKALRRDSELLFDIHRKFLFMINKRLSRESVGLPPINIMCFYEELETPPFRQVCRS